VSFVWKCLNNNTCSNFGTITCYYYTSHKNV